MSSRASTRLRFRSTRGERHVPVTLSRYSRSRSLRGKFGPAKEFAEVGTFDFLEYGRDVGEISGGRIYPNGPGPDAVSFAVPQPDFNVGSLRGNAVLKWDWRPGSTMYVAWQQTRDSFSPIGDFGLSRDLDTLFRTRPDNIFLVKVSYWLNP